MVGKKQSGQRPEYRDAERQRIKQKKDTRNKQRKRDTKAWRRDQTSREKRQMMGDGHTHASIFRYF